MGEIYKLKVFTIQVGGSHTSSKSGLSPDYSGTPL